MIFITNPAANQERLKKLEFFSAYLIETPYERARTRNLRRAHDGLD